MMTNEQLRSALQRWTSVRSGPFFSEDDLPRAMYDGFLPAQYLDLAADIGGREGFFGDQYIRFYRLGELARLNQAYQIPTYNPELFIFASDGYGEAFAFCVAREQIVKVPRIPIPTQNADVLANSFGEFIEMLARSGPSPDADPSALGTELHLIKPLCFGGDWHDPANTVRVTPVQYGELVTYWNKLYRGLVPLNH